MEKQIPDFLHPPHNLPSLYNTSAMLLLCKQCGHHELVEDVWDENHFRSEKTLPCDCQICGGIQTVDAVDDDMLLQQKIG